MYKIGDLVRLKNGSLARLIQQIGSGSYWAKTTKGNTVVGIPGNDLEITSHAEVVNMKKCQSCLDFIDEAYFDKFENEEMCKTCYDICCNEQVNEQNDLKTRAELYNWGKI